MKTKKEHSYIFLVLVPHRDVRFVLRGYSTSLFKAGFTGAYHFPWAAPLASLSSPLDHDELKKTADAIRKSVDRGIITASETGTVPFPEEGSGAMLLGPKLGFGDIRQFLPADKVKGIFLKPVIGCCFIDNSEETPALHWPPPLSFRAAAVANMIWQPVYSRHNEGIGYKWKIGKLCWLPPVR